MMALIRVALLSLALVAAGCGSGAEDPEDRGNAAPDLSSEPSPASVPLPPETEPTGVGAPAPPDTLIDY